MRKKATCRLAACVLLGALLFDRAAHAGDAWPARDKTLHASVSLVLATQGYAWSAPLTDDRRLRLLSGALVSAAAGVSKEWADGRVSRGDLAADAIGAGMGLMVMWLWDRLTSATSTR